MADFASRAPWKWGVGGIWRQEEVCTGAVSFARLVTPEVHLASGGDVAPMVTIVSEEWPSALLLLAGPWVFLHFLPPPAFGLTTHNRAVYMWGKHRT